MEYSKNYFDADWRLLIETLFLYKDSSSEPEQGPSTTQDAAEVAADSGTAQEAKSFEKGKDKEDKDKEKAKEPDKEKGKEKDSERKGEIEREKLKGVEGTNLDALLQRLPSCVGRDLIDQLTVMILSYLYYLAFFSRVAPRSRWKISLFYFVFRWSFAI